MSNLLLYSLASVSSSPSSKNGFQLASFARTIFTGAKIPAFKPAFLVFRAGAHTRAQVREGKRWNINFAAKIFRRLKMSTSPRRITFCKVFEHFPLDNFDGWTESDIQTITQSIQIFKRPESFPDRGSFNFLETRDLRLITQFFAIYGDDIRETEFDPCVKLNGNCICFLKSISDKEIELIQKVVHLFDVKACQNCSVNFLSQLQNILDR